MEMTLSVVLMVVVMQIMAESTLIMSRSGNFGAKQVRIIAQNQHALQKIANELRTSSMFLDPTTGDSYAVIGGEKGARTITFRRVAAFGDNGQELLPVWSTPIEYHLEGGLLIRTQDGQDTVVLRGVVWVEFLIDGLGRFGVELSNRAEADSTAATEVMQTIRVTPMF